MRILCVSQNYPAELADVAAYLAKSHMVFVASLRHPRQEHPAGTRRIILKRCDQSRFERNYLGYLALGVRTAQNCATAWQALIDSDYAPDLILACASNGLGLGLRQRFPDSFISVYADTKMPALLARSRELHAARKQIEGIGFSEADARFAAFAWLGGGAQVLPLMIDCEFFCRGAQNPQRQAIVCTGGASCATIAEIWQECLRFLAVRRDWTVAILLENSLRDFPWRERVAALPASLGQRIRLCVQPTREEWRDSLAQSLIVFCPRADSAIMGRLLAAMACEVPVAGSADAAAPLPPGARLLPWAGLDMRATLELFSKADTAGLAAANREAVLAHNSAQILAPAHAEWLLGQCAYKKKPRP